MSADRHVYNYVESARCPKDFKCVFHHSEERKRKRKRKEKKKKKNRPGRNKCVKCVFLQRMYD